MRSNCLVTYFVFIITDKERDKERKWDSVGVMKDKELKFEDVTPKKSKDLWGRPVESDEPECTWEWGVWAWGGCGCLWYSDVVRYNIVIWLRKNRHKVWGEWSEQKTKGPECKWEGGTWTWVGWGCVCYVDTVRCSTDIWTVGIEHRQKRKDLSGGEFIIKRRSQR